MDKINFSEKKIFKNLLLIPVVVLVFLLGYFASTWLFETNKQPLVVNNTEEVADEVVDETVPEEEIVSEFNETIDGKVEWFSEWKILAYASADYLNDNTASLVQLGRVSEGEYVDWGLFLEINPLMGGDEYKYFLQKEFDKGLKIFLAEAAPLLKDIKNYPDSVQYKG